MNKIFILIIVLILAFGGLYISSTLLVQKDCVKEGEHFSKVYEEYQEKCCNGLTEWASGFDTRVSIGNECYATGRLAGSPIGTCINCGNDVCEEIEDVCNCPQDCQNGENSMYTNAEMFCNEWEKTCSSNETMQPIPACDLCQKFF